MCENLDTERQRPHSGSFLILLIVKSLHLELFKFISRVIVSSLFFTFVDGMDSVILSNMLYHLKKMI